MSRAIVLIVASASIGAAGILASVSAAQAPPYDVLMRDIQATFDSLRQNLDANAAASVAQDAARLEELFKHTEDFWTPFRTRTAIEAARGAQKASAAAAGAARQNDMQEAKAAASGLGKFCETCHTIHREQMPDRSYRIKP